MEDLRSLKIDGGLSVTAESMEFNVLGAGHEFWIAVRWGIVVACAVLAEEKPDFLRILHLEVTPMQRNKGVGSSLLKVIIKEQPERGLLVVPFDGTEEFYKQLGFVPVGRWEMKLAPRGK